MTHAVESSASDLVAPTGTQGESPGVTAAHLLPLVYDELRRMAHRYLADERPGHTLQATALVHEAYVRLARHSRTKWQSPAHLRAVGAQAMRRILIDHARRRAAGKRGGRAVAVTLSDAIPGTGRSDVSLHDVIVLDRALEALEEVDRRGARVVELRFFGGLTMEEISESLGVSLRSVEGDWKHARAWLRRALSGSAHR